MTATHVIETTARDDRDVRVRTRQRPPHTLPVPARLHDNAQFHHDPVVLAAIEGHQGALNAAAALVDRVEDTYWTLAGVLYEIDDKGLYRDKGCQDFKEYAERELGIGYQKARQFVQIYRTFRELNIYHQRLSEIGWTKVRDIGRLVGNNDLGDSMDEIMAFAEAHSRADTVGHIKRTYISASEERVRETKFVVRATGPAADVIDRAVARAKRLAEEDTNNKADNNKAFEWICGEWSEYTEGIELSLEEYVTILFGRFGEEAVLAHFRERSRTED